MELVLFRWGSIREEWPPGDDADVRWQDAPDVDVLRCVRQHAEDQVTWYDICCWADPLEAPAFGTNLQHFLAPGILVNIYNCLILPHLYYGVLVWGYERTRIFNVQKNHWELFLLQGMMHTRSHFSEIAIFSRLKIFIKCNNSSFSTT